MNLRITAFLGQCAHGRVHDRMLINTEVAAQLLTCVAATEAVCAQACVAAVRRDEGAYAFGHGSDIVADGDHGAGGACE